MRRVKKAAVKSKVRASRKTALAKTLHGFDEHEAELVNQVRATVAGSLRAGGDRAVDAAKVVRDIVSGLAASSTRSTLVGAKAVAHGVLLGVSDVGGDVLGAASNTAREMVRATSNIGGDTATVVWRTISGVLDAGREVDLSLGKLAEAVASGATSAGTAAAGAVHQALLGVAEGVQNVLPEAPAGAGKAQLPARRARPTKKPVRLRVAKKQVGARTAPRSTKSRAQ